MAALAVLSGYRKIASWPNVNRGNQVAIPPSPLELQSAYRESGLGVSRQRPVIRSLTASPVYDAGSNGVSSIVAALDFSLPKSRANLMLPGEPYF